MKRKSTSGKGVARILFCADVHVYPDPIVFPSVLRCLRYLARYALEVKPDMIIFGGDFWDREVYLSQKVKGDSRFEDLKDESSFLSVCCKVIKDMTLSGAWLYFIYGTPMHERPGSLSVFKHLSTRIKVIEKPEIIEHVTHDNEPVRILFVPGEMPIDSPEVQRLARRKPDLLVAHGSIYDSTASTSQTAAGGAYEVETLKEIAPLVLLGHLHKKQQIGTIYYPGSLDRITLNEANDPVKGFWDIITTTPPEMRFVSTPARVIYRLTIKSKEIVIGEDSLVPEKLKEVIYSSIGEPRMPGIGPDGMPYRADLYVSFLINEQHRDIMPDIIKETKAVLNSEYPYFSHIKYDRKIVSHHNVCASDVHMKIIKAKSTEEKLRLYLDSVENQNIDHILERYRLLESHEDLSVDDVISAFSAPDEPTSGLQATPR